jgi:hypothetical protein
MELPGEETAAAISASRLSIYENTAHQPGLFYDLQTLEGRLDAGLRGIHFEYPIRTRAKVVKTAIAELLGYPVPSSFRKTQPRFPGQNMDVYVQTANNLQIWNEEVDPHRRYAIVKLGADHCVTVVRVLTGEELALLDRTGTLTSKYQAKRKVGRNGSCLVSSSDTERFVSALGPRDSLDSRTLNQMKPTETPINGQVLSIVSLFTALRRLEGTVLVDPGLIQDRNRGTAFQHLVCSAIGLDHYEDLGQFPDILSQALEVKLQLSPTIDLGLVTPASVEPVAKTGDIIRHCDTRYCVAYGSRVGSDSVRIDEIVLTPGEHFFDEFQRFEGNVQNAKLQIPLPESIFKSE